MRYSTPEQRRQHAFAIFQRELARTVLPDGDGGTRYAAPDEFMFMDMKRDKRGRKVTSFKHCASRNYLWLVAGRIRLGDGESLWQLNTFPGAQS